MTQNQTDNLDDDGRFSEKDIRTIALAVISGIVFGGVATGVAFPTLPLLDQLLGISAVMLGIILSANRFTRIPLNAPAGNIIDRYGARRPMIIGLFVQSMAPFGYLLGMNVPRETFVVLPEVGAVSYPAVVFLCARAMWGIGSAFVFLGAFATITYVTTNQNRGRWLGYMRGGQSIGFPSGLILGGIVTDILNPQLAFLMAGLLALSAGIIGFRVLPDVKPAETETESGAGLRAIPGMIQREPRIFPLGIGNMTLRFLYSGVILATIVKYANVNNLELSVLSAAGISGLVLGTGVISSGTATFFSGRLSDELSNRALITVPTFICLMIGFIVLITFPTLWGLFLSVILIGTGTGGTTPALMAILGDITPGNEIGRMGSVYNLLGDIGSTAGPLLSVPMVEIWFGYQTTYWICFALIFVTLVLVAVPLLYWDVGVTPERSRAD